MILKKISMLSLILGTVLLIYWTKVFREEGIYLIRSELFYIFALIFGIFYFIHPHNINKLISIKNWIYFALSVLLISIFLATGISLFIYNLMFIREGIIMFIKLFLCIILFILTYTYLKKEKLFYKRICIAFYAPPLIFIPFLIYPKLVKEFYTKFNFSLIAPGEEQRFSGLSSGSPIFSQSVIIALSFLYALFLYNYHKRNWIRSLFYLCLNIGLLGLLFWSQSKGFLITAILIIILENILMSSYFKKDIVKSVLYNMLAILLIACIFLILPIQIKHAVYTRFSHFYIKDRILLSKYYSELFFLNPLGLGINYYEEYAIKRPELGDPLPPHNSILDMAVLGGIGALFSIFLLLWKAFLNIKAKIKDKNNPLAIYFLGTGVAIFGIWFAGMFEGAPFFYLGFWILLAMALA